MSLESWMRLDRSLALTRRLMLVFVGWMTWESYAWSSNFAVLSERDGMQVAAIIAAITTPISALAVMVFKTYTESRQ